MAATKATRLSKIARQFNIGINTIVEFMHKKGEDIDSNPNTKISPEQYEMLLQEFSSDLDLKKESDKVDIKKLKEKQKTVSLNDVEGEDNISEPEQEELIIKGNSVEPTIFETESEKNLDNKVKLNVVGKIDIDKKKESKPDTKKEVPASKEPAEEPAEEPIEKEEETVVIDPEVVDKEEKPEKEEQNVKIVGKIDLESMNQKTRPTRRPKPEKEAKTKKGKKPTQYNKPEQKPKTEQEIEKKETRAEKTVEAKKTVEPTQKSDEKKEADVIKTKFEKLSGPTVLGRIDLPEEKKKQEGQKPDHDKKKKRKRIKKDKSKVNVDKSRPPRQDHNKPSKKTKRKPQRPEVSEEEVQKQIKDTLARLTSKGKSKGSKYRREKRDAVSQKMQEETLKQEQSKNILKVTEFIPVSELANLMDVPVTDLIATCMNLGLFVSINQRLDAETMTVLAEEYGYKIEFTTIEVVESVSEEEEDAEEDLQSRSPIITVMGHVDHGKTKLLDYVRKANVISGEAGGITQHIGAYSVILDDNKKITFLDTPGHEAFTAMRARGAQVTDIAIILVAADDGIKPQTVEAINHAQAAGVPMVFAINKIDKPTANPERVKEELANMNILVEDWGGKYQSQEISAKNGINIEELLEKVLLEAELLELKANPNKMATGTVIESSLDKGRGYVATILVQSGTLNTGDIMLAGIHTGRVKAMYNERGQNVQSAGPATPVLILGLDGAPQAGDKFNILKTDREAKEIANKREQLQREQGMRSQKHITLDEIGRRIAIGNFQELNIVVKGDVDGSVEAIADSLIKLSNEEIQVNIIHKGVGQISESDIMLAAASDAIVLGFQVRPSMGARKIAEKEEIDIRLYSIIYDAIEEVKSAMEGMLSPEIKEEIVATLEVLDTFKITKVGTIAGCMVKEGKIKRTSKVRVIRDGIVIYTGNLGSLKRFKDEVKEVVTGLECGIGIESFNDIKVGDMIEGFEETEVKKKL